MINATSASLKCVVSFRSKHSLYVLNRWELFIPPEVNYEVHPCDIFRLRQLPTVSQPNDSGNSATIVLLVMSTQRYIETMLLLTYNIPAPNMTATRIFFFRGMLSLRIEYMGAQIIKTSDTTLKDAEVINNATGSIHFPGIDGFQIFSLGEQGKIAIKNKIVYMIRFDQIKAWKVQWTEPFSELPKILCIWKRTESFEKQMSGQKTWYIILAS